MQRSRGVVLAGVSLVALGMGVAACGSSSSSSSTTTSSSGTTMSSTTGTMAGSTAAGTMASTSSAPPVASGPAKKGPVTVTLGSPQEFSLTATPAVVKAGSVTFTVKNGGQMTHQLLVIKTTTAAANLPLASDGSADTTGKVGGIDAIDAGATQSVTISLTAGHYALICNLPGHYAGGMHTDLTVK
ncbi:MAG: plastocyanin/azurin family copper-binding protein [Thermoleophilia bacterium]